MSGGGFAQAGDQRADQTAAAEFWEFWRSGIVAIVSCQTACLRAKLVAKGKLAAMKICGFLCRLYRV